MKTSFKNRDMSRVICLIGIILLISVGYFGYTKYSTPPVQMVEATDMRGMKVSVPAKINSVVTLNETADQIVYAVNKDLLKGCQPNFINKVGILPEDEQARLKNLPAINPHYKPMSTEAIVSIHPDVIVDLLKDPNLDTRTTELNAPVYAISKDTINDIADGFEYVGNITGNAERGKTIKNFINDEMSAIKAKTDTIADKKKVFMANGKGLATPGPKTIMEDALEKAGAETYWSHHELGSENPTSEGIQIPIEALLDFNPDVIVCKGQADKDLIMQDERLKNISAVKDNKVYVTLSYLRLDSVHSVPGVVWLVNHIYPGLQTDGCYNFAAKYFNLLYGTDLNAGSKILREENK